MSASALHTFGYKGRHGIKEQLRFLPLEISPVSVNINNENQFSNGSGTEFLVMVFRIRNIDAV